MKNREPDPHSALITRQQTREGQRGRGTGKQGGCVAVRTSDSRAKSGRGVREVSERQGGGGEVELMSVGAGTLSRQKEMLKSVRDRSAQGQWTGAAPFTFRV